MKRKVFVLLALMAWSCKAERNTGATSVDAVHPMVASPTINAQRVGGAPPVGMPRIIVRTAEVSLVVSDAAKSLETLTQLAAAHGGYAADSRLWRDGKTVRATLTLRVPSAQLDAALAAIRKAAVRVDSESIGGDDMTQEYVDLDSQVRNLEAAETEMRQLMTTVRERTSKAEDILQVYQQLTQLRGQIETAKGRMRYLSQMSAMSTIRATLIPDAASQPLADTLWQPLAVARDAGRALLKTSEGLVDIAIWAVIYFGPFLLIAGGIAIVIRRTVRRRATAA